MDVKHPVTLRSFKKYHPKQIAKFVKAFFNGRFFIAGLGRLRMINGKVVAYKHQQSETKVLRIVSEINKAIKNISNKKKLNSPT